MKTLKSYKKLKDELASIIEETERYKQSNDFGTCKKMGLWNNSTYLDELLYIKTTIEHEIIPYEIVSTMKFHQWLLKSLPIELVKHIASFGTMEDTIAATYVELGVNATVEDLYKQ